MKVAEHTKQIDGIDYEIAVRDEVSGFFGSWFCGKCWMGGVKYESLPSIEAAMAQAENGATVHHEQKHTLR
jgi:hypothetical protein